MRKIGSLAALLTSVHHSTGTMLMLFSHQDHLARFKDYMNSCHQNMRFTSELENDDVLAFLDIKVIRSNGCFLTSVYRKPTFSGVYTNYNSFLLEKLVLYKHCFSGSSQSAPIGV